MSVYSVCCVAFDPQIGSGRDYLGKPRLLGEVESFTQDHPARQGHNQDSNLGFRLRLVCLIPPLGNLKPPGSYVSCPRRARVTCRKRLEGVGPPIWAVAGHSRPGAESRATLAAAPVSLSHHCEPSPIPGLLGKTVGDVRWQSEEPRALLPHQGMHMPGEVKD